VLVVLNTLAQPFAAEMRETLKKRLARFVPKPQQNSQPDVCGGTMQPGPYDCGPSALVMLLVEAAVLPPVHDTKTQQMMIGTCVLPITRMWPVSARCGVL